jgi:hypothetical protein
MGHGEIIANCEIRIANLKRRGAWGKDRDQDKNSRSHRKHDEIGSILTFRG